MSCSDFARVAAPAIYEFEASFDGSALTFTLRFDTDITFDVLRWKRFTPTNGPGG